MVLQTSMELDDRRNIVSKYSTLFKDTPLARAAHNPSWLEVVHGATVNNPEYHSIEQAAALGIGNARSLGEIFNLVSFLTHIMYGLSHLLIITNALCISSD